MRWVVSGALLLSFSLAPMPRARAAEAARSFSAWYRFEAPSEPGFSSGWTPWPAYALAARSGPGKRGTGLVLDGSPGNGLYLPNPAAFFGGEARRGTVALWVKPAFNPAAEQGQRVVFDFMRQAGNTLVDGHEIVCVTDGSRLKAWASLERVFTLESPLRRDEWTHLALTWDCEQGTAFYVNGEKKAERKGPFKPIPLESGWPGRVGCHTPGGGFPFAGTLDELRLFNTSLSDAMVRALCDIEPAGPGLRVEAAPATGGARKGGAPPRQWRVKNTGREPVSVGIQVWEPPVAGATGYLPFPFGSVPPETTFWTAGASPARAVGSTVTVLPGGSASLRIPPSRDPLARRRVRLVAGEGLSAVEVAGVTTGGLAADLCGFAPRVYLAGQPLPLRVRVKNDTGSPFSGAMRVDVADAAGKALGSTQIPVTLADGAATEVAGRGPSLRPGAYRARLTAVQGGRQALLNEVAVYATAPGSARTLCDVAATCVRPPDLEATLAAMARDGVVAIRQSRGGGDYYNAEQGLAEALADGLKVWRMPAASYHSVCALESRRESLRRTARNLGRYLRDNPAVLNQVIAGEGLSCPPCYCEACTAGFRASLREEYGRVEALNRAWGTQYASWDQVQPLGSPRDIDETAERLKMMKVALELPAANAARWRKLFELDRPRAMAWKRWHERKLIGWYADFARAFRETNGGRTPLSEQPCWPNFESHVLFALGEIADLGGMDLYLPGEGPTTLGYAAELFLNFDMNASVFASRGKPLMVHELYVQDNSHALLPEAQGWWLVGRGYGLLSYFTYDYYYEGIRAGKPLIFGLFSKEGPPYPTYPSFQRFSRDVKAFNARYPHRSLRREAPRVALFMGDDVSLANNLETGGATWEAAGVQGANGSYWLTERSGHPVEFVNDGSLDRLAGKRALVVPWCHVIRPESIAKILAFARAGGTVIFDGPVGLYDHRYIPYSPLPGGTLSQALDITFGGYKDEPNAIVVRDGVLLPSQGVAIEPKVRRGAVLLRDAAGRPALVRMPLGKGKVLAFLSSPGRKSLSRSPNPEAVALWSRLLREDAGVTPRYRLFPAAATDPGVGLLAPPADEGGKPPVFDVSVRLRGDREMLLFLTSFFEPTRGTLELALPRGTCTAADAVTGDPLPPEAADGRFTLSVDLPAFGSRVIHIRAADGRPFATW